MPAISALSLTDGTTPVALTPFSRSADVSKYRGTAASTLAANPSLTMRVTENNGVQRQIIRYTEPVVVTDTSTSEDLVKENVIVEINIRVPGICSSALRETAVKRALDVARVGNLDVELSTGEGQW